MDSCPYCGKSVQERSADDHLDDCRARAIAELKPSKYSATSLQRRASEAGTRPETAAQALERMRARTEAWTQIAARDELEDEDL